MAAAEGPTLSSSVGEKRRNEDDATRARNPKSKVARVSTSSSSPRMGCTPLNEEEEHDDLELELQLKIEEAQNMAKAECKFPDVRGSSQTQLFLFV